MARKNSKPSKPNIEKEYRFAVVMYGGVSLAIYINGVAQELFKMVRATARKKNQDGTFGGYIVQNPEGTEAVYRELGKRLKARFVVDILSGTSAGGINAVYLAKALANRQSMSQLEKVWVEEGDIKSLINDRGSLKNIRDLPLTRPPKSLLNSDRMYYQLFKALEGMDEGEQQTGDGHSQFVDELDLYITSTDLRGLSLPIVLADGVTHENRYRMVFAFYHATLGEKKDWTLDFKRENNPFLAFAARATSAFPFAFRPARLGDAGPLLGIIPSWKSMQIEELAKNWRNFYRDYSLEVDRFPLRSFGDGGALDNKPFSYITETLRRRQSDVPVDRRLFYVEPAPEGPPKNNRPQDDEPDVVQNLLAQGFSLPRYETIREDLLQIKFRNDLIEKTNSILRQIEGTRDRIHTIWKSGKSNRLNWPEKYLDEILSEYGVGYAAYHQLRVADTLDHFAVAVARNLGMDENGSAFSSLRKVFEEWRKRMYSPDSRDRNNLHTENDLLFRMDLHWHVRRLYFILRVIDDLLLGLKVFRQTHQDTHGPDEAQARRGRAEEIVRKSNREDKIWVIPDLLTENQYIQTLTNIKHELNKTYTDLRTRGRKLRRRNLATNPLDPEEPANLQEVVTALQPLLAYRNDFGQVLEQDRDIQRLCDMIENLSLTLGARPNTPGLNPIGYLHETIGEASKRCKSILSIGTFSNKGLPIEASFPDKDGILRNVQACLQFYYEHFEYFDMLTFPITYATPIGESDVVEVYRISPADAKGLMVETESRKKLAGTGLANFGGFLKAERRQNDILWGQLDAAERIIVTLLPDPKKNTDLVIRAWLAILKEKIHTFTPGNRNALKAHFEKLSRPHEGAGSAWDVFQGTQKFTSGELKILKEELRVYFADEYAPDLGLSLTTQLGLVVRSALVGVGLGTSLLRKYFRAFLGRISKPKSLQRQSAQRRLNISSALGALLIIVSVSLSFLGRGTGLNNGLLGLGVTLMLVALVFNLVIHLYGKRIIDTEEQNTEETLSELPQAFPSDPQLMPPGR